MKESKKNNNNIEHALTLRLTGCCPFVICSIGERQSSSVEQSFFLFFHFIPKDKANEPVTKIYANIALKCLTTCCPCCQLV